MRREESVLDLAESLNVAPAEANPALARWGSTSIAEPERVAVLGRRPNVRLAELLSIAGAPVDQEVAAWADIELKYAGYLVRERAAAARLSQLDEFLLPANLEYQNLRALSIEARQKLAAARPGSLGEAGRIPGVSPSDLQGLVFEVLKRRG